VTGVQTCALPILVDQFVEIEESLLVGLQRDGDVVIALFLKMMPGNELTDELVDALKKKIRENKTPRHVPGLVKEVPDIPHTRSGKIVESAVRNIFNGRAVENEDALANPDSLRAFRKLAEELA